MASTSAASRSCECGEPIPDGRRKFCSHRCSRRAIERRYRARHPEADAAKRTRRITRRREEYREWYAVNRERVAAYHRANADRDRPRKAETQRARRARVRGNGVLLVTSRDLRRLTARYRGLCAYCPALAGEWDHVVPIRRGGRHSIGNLLPACADCNRRKQRQLLSVWRYRK